MRQLHETVTTAIASLGILAMLSSPSLAAGGHDTRASAPQTQLAHMSGGRSGQPCPTGAMGWGMTGPGMMRPGMMGPGMMGPGMMGPGMMGPGMMGPGMMGPGMMGSGMMMPGWMQGPAARPGLDLSADDVRTGLERSLAWHGNKRLKVGEIEEADDDTIIAEIVTLDGSLVQRLEVDRHTGWTKQID